MGNQGSLDNTPYYAYQIIAQASRSVSSRSVAEKRSRAFLASYFPPTSSTTASKSPTSFVWPRACACSNAPTNQAFLPRYPQPTLSPTYYILRYAVVRTVGQGSCSYYGKDERR